ncbi:MULTISPECIES: HGxxPAAW family protein [Brevibacterium]|uniref:DUF2530 domain-containing protein n=1 Tax=Brevibacterium pityocampae TaxID=506594 RepID=A0ABP8JEA7_9MICO|nr:MULTISPECIES: HGxxPAAW family protein [unclassified Brevibacterium]MCK1802524.1 hypothetical protein [Brevibacterium sp. R8603A2]QCP05862.1 hypothetical protein FDF13_11685 [Brevibacterium sp. CS2]
MTEIIARDGTGDLDRSSIDYTAVQDPGHGNTVAGWTGVFIIFAGAIIATFGSVAGNWTVFWAGIIVCAIGPIVGLVLRAAGKGGKQKSGHHR